MEELKEQCLLTTFCNLACAYGKRRERDIRITTLQCQCRNREPKYCRSIGKSAVR